MSSFDKAIHSMFSSSKKTDRQMAEQVLNNPDSAEDLKLRLAIKTKETKGLNKWFDEVDTIGSMVVDYAKGNYREVPLNTIIGATAALIYFLSPIDILPDVVVGLGQLDDIAVLAFAIKSISHDIDKYREWKGLSNLSTEKRFESCIGKTTKESATITDDIPEMPDEIPEKMKQLIHTKSDSILMTHHPTSESVLETADALRDRFRELTGEDKE